jgi:hypothetical protein
VTSKEGSDVADNWPPYQPAYIHQPPPYRQHSTAPAYASAALFLACALLSFMLAFGTWDNSANPHVLAAVIGIVFSGRLTGNVDFGISATLTVACTTTTFALVLFSRLAFARWILAGVGALVTVYYVIALVYLVANNAARFVAWPFVALLLWGAATLIALLPATGHAMRGRQNAVPPPGHGYLM